MIIVPLRDPACKISSIAYIPKLSVAVHRKIDILIDKHLDTMTTAVRRVGAVEMKMT